MKPFRVIIFRSAAVASIGVSLALFSVSCNRPNLNGGNPSVVAPLPYGTKIDFGQTGQANGILTSGWSKPEQKFTWTEGNSAVLTIPIAATEKPVMLRMILAGMIKEPEKPMQLVEVNINDRKVADWQVGNTAPFSAPIPREFTKIGGTLVITFKIPGAISPKALGKNEDPRVLGLCVFSLELS